MYIVVVTIMLVICFLKLREEVLLKSNALKGENSQVKISQFRGVYKTSRKFI